MSIFSWNIRGVGNPKAFRALRELVTGNSPKYILIMETRAETERIEQNLLKLGFCWSNYCTTCWTKQGSSFLAFLWKYESPTLLSLSKHHIDADIISEIGLKQHLIGLYKEPAWQQRHISWNLLTNLANQSHLQWCMIGDFNTSLH